MALAGKDSAVIVDVLNRTTALSAMLAARLRRRPCIGIVTDLPDMLGGSGFSYTLAQVFCAFAVGICYGAVTVRFGSLIPCFLAHFLTNVTAAPASAGTAPWLWLCIAACGGFGICLCKNVTK